MDVAVFAQSGLLGIGLTAVFCKVNSGGIAPGIAVLLPGLLLGTQKETVSDVPLASFIVAALAPIAMGLTLLPPFSRISSNRWRAILISLIALIPVAIALALAMRAETLDFGES
jgi:hypothetical protein